MEILLRSGSLSMVRDGSLASEFVEDSGVVLVRGVFDGPSVRVYF